MEIHYQTSFKHILAFWLKDVISFEVCCVCDQLRLGRCWMWQNSIAVRRRKSHQWGFSN